MGWQRITCFFFSLAACSEQRHTRSVTEHSETPWTLVFADEFSEQSLDAGKWLSYYDPGNPGDVLELIPAHFTLSDGVLHLTIDSQLPKRSAIADAVVSSVQTAALSLPPSGQKPFAHFSQRYGRFEIRCRTARGSGVHSAVWLLHEPQTSARDDVAATEIDLFEQLGIEAQAGKIHFNVHPTQGGHAEENLDFDPSAAFHVYALEWEEGVLRWYVDGRLVRRYEGRTPKEKTLLFLSVYQGASDWKGPVVTEGLYPIDFAIDYVRVYRGTSAQAPRMAAP